MIAYSRGDSFYETPLRSSPDRFCRHILRADACHRLLPRTAGGQHLEYAGGHAARIAKLGRLGNHHRPCRPQCTPTSGPARGTEALSAYPGFTVPGTQTKYPATFTYADESDPGPYAIPLSAPIEGGSASTGDRHALSVDTANCILYELYSAYPQASSWQAGSGAIFNLVSNALRPAGWTSTDAAGLPVFPGLVRYDEIAARRDPPRHPLHRPSDAARLRLARPPLRVQPDRHAVSADGARFRLAPASTSPPSRPTSR